MTNKILFPIVLDGKTRSLRDTLTRKLSYYTDLPRSDLLEIGIGNGRFGFLLGDRVASYSGVDIDPEMVEIAKTNIPEGAKINYKVGRGENIPFYNKFDIVFYALSWHFMKNFNKALSEADRVLKEDGIVAILEPSERSRSWADTRLRKGWPDFNEDMLNQKISELRIARQAIREQKSFKIVENQHITAPATDFYVLKK